MAAPEPFNAPDIKRRMNGATESLKHDFGGLRTGRASATLLDPIQVDAYGANMPLTQVASVSVPEARLLQISVWDRGLVASVEKAIHASNLGLNPQTEGSVIRLRMPDLTQDRRKELVKVAHQYSEKAKVAARNVRRDANDGLKTDENKKVISEDDRKRLETEVQKMTDEMIKAVDEAAANKEKEILSQ